MSQGAPPDFVPPQIAGQPIQDPPFPYPSATPKELIANMISQLANIEVAWRDDAQLQFGSSGGPMAWIYLTISKVEALGWDEERTQNDPANPNVLDFNLCGQRLLTISCRCESIDASIEPNDILERVRWTQRSSLGQTLRDQGSLAICNYGDIHMLGVQTIDNVRVKVAVMDLILARALNAPEPGTIPTTINTVDGGTQAPGTPPTIPGFITGEGALHPNFTDNVAEILISVGTAPSYPSAGAIPAGAVVTDAKVIITGAYSAGTTIQVGSAATPNLLMASGNSDPQVVGQYDATQNTSWPTAGAVLVAVAGSPTVGSAIVAVQYVIPGP